MITDSQNIDIAKRLFQFLETLLRSIIVKLHVYGKVLSSTGFCKFPTFGLDVVGHVVQRAFLQCSTHTAVAVFAGIVDMDGELFVGFFV